jgi:hypothetical protein
MGRTGWGPLNVAWDTGILIDFAAYGRAILDGEFKPSGEMDPDRANEMTALQVLLDVGWARDIRVYVCGLQEFDARKPLSEDRLNLRQRQLFEIAAALECIGHESVSQLLDERRELIPGLDAVDLSDLDRGVVNEALARGCHIFLTFDKGILKRSGKLASLGLLALTPIGLLDALASADELTGHASPCAGIWPDSHKFHHLYGALATPRDADSLGE